MSSATPDMDTGEETVRLLALLVRQNAGSQARAIADLDKAGFKPRRVGELLGTSADTAKNEARRMRKAAKK